MSSSAAADSVSHSGSDKTKKKTGKKIKLPIWHTAYFYPSQESTLQNLVGIDFTLLTLLARVFNSF